MDIDGGGWTVFQRRVDNSINFERNWTAYKQGFGNLRSNFWLGLDAIHNLTKKGAMFRVDLIRTDGKRESVKYSHFKIADESDNYRLDVSGFSGSFSNAFVNSNGVMFSTADRDNDPHDEAHCAALLRGGWWHVSCFDSLNGLFPRHGIKIRTMSWGLEMIYSEIKIRGKYDLPRTLSVFPMPTILFMFAILSFL